MVTKLAARAQAAKEGAIRSHLTFLCMDQNRRLPIQFYTKCKNPSFPMDEDVLYSIAKNYSSLIEGSEIDSTARHIVNAEFRAEDFGRLVSSNPTAKAACIPSHLTSLFMDENKLREAIQFYTKCKNPSFPMDPDVLPSIKKSYFSLIEGDEIDSTARHIVNIEFRAEDFERLVNSNPKAKVACITSHLTFLCIDQDRRLPIQFYTKCKNPSFPMDPDVLPSIKKSYFSLIEGNEIDSTARHIVNAGFRTEDFEHLVNSNPTLRP